MIAEILTIGDELLRGEIVDSNKAFLAERLLLLEIETHFQSSVRDDPTTCATPSCRARERADVVLVSGGLGPTRDDLTIEVLAQTLGRELVLHEPSLAEIRAFFAASAARWPRSTRSRPGSRSARTCSPNPVGTAPGCVLEAPREGGRARLFFCLPGVPRELMQMMDEQVLPRLEARLAPRPPPRAMRAVLLRTFGLGESNLDQELRDVAREADVALGFRTAFPDNYLRPVARGATAEEAEARLAKVCDAIRERLGALVYGRATRRWSRWWASSSPPRAHARDGRVLHRRARRASAHRRARRLALLPGRRRRLRKRGEARPPRRAGGAPRATRSGVGRGRARHGRGRAGALRRGPRGLDHGHLRARTAARREKPVGLVFVGFASRREQRGARALPPPRPRAPPRAHGAGRPRPRAPPPARRAAARAALRPGGRAE